LIAGRGLVKSDTVNMFVVNEAFVRALGMKNPEEALGVTVDIWSKKYPIEGVVKDFNTTSLHNKIDPVIMMADARNLIVGAVKLETSDVKQVLQKVEKTWKEQFPDYVFESTFLDDTINHFYDAERRTSKLVSIFASVAILIGCIGLLGLVSFMVTRRTKEVGIRKTLGATVTNIVTLFSKEFVILVGISFVIAAPLSYYMMNQWLEKFAYRITPGILTYLAGISLIIFVVIATVGYISFRAATANPVVALRDE
jgi:ABC-type antimicrobial peptide transport system permease subunit